MAPHIKVARAYNAMKAFGYSSQIVKPVLKNLLDLYDQNWELIEDEQYKVLLDAVIESREHKRKCQEDSPAGRRYSLRSHTLRASPRSGHSSPSFCETTDKPPRSNGKQKFTDSACRVEDTIVEYALKNHQKAERVVNSQHYYSEEEFTEKIELLPGENINESDPQSAEILLCDGGDNDYSGSIIPKQVTNDAKGIGSVSWEEKNFKHKSNLPMQKNDLDKNHASATSELGKSTMITQSLGFLLQ